MSDLFRVCRITRIAVKNGEELLLIVSFMKALYTYIQVRSLAASQIF